MSAITVVSVILLVAGFGLVGFLVGWFLGYRAGGDDAREQAADTFTRYLRRQELRS